MTDYGVAKIQLGKNGLSENFFATLESYFKIRKNVKVIVLKSAREEKTMTKKYGEEIMKRLGKKYTAKIVGHTIAIKRWRRDREEKDDED